MYLHEYFYRQGNFYFERVTDQEVYIQPESSAGSLEKQFFVLDESYPVKTNVFSLRRSVVDLFGAEKLSRS